MDSISDLQQKQREFVRSRNWDKFGSPKNLSMALAVEAAELMQEFMWLSDQQIEALPIKYPDRFQNVKEELADVFLYLLRIADTMQIDLIQAGTEKILKNEKKHPIEKSLATAAEFS